MFWSCAYFLGHFMLKRSNSFPSDLLSDTGLREVGKLKIRTLKKKVSNRSSNSDIMKDPPPLDIENTGNNPCGGQHNPPKPPNP